MADRKVSVKVDADVSPFIRGMSTAATAAKAFSRELESTDNRFATMTRAALALTPALVPIGAVAVPAIAGLATQLGAAAGAAGVAALAFNGVGDALEALNDAQLEPTAANIEKARTALDELGPAGADFVRFLDQAGERVGVLQEIAREGMFPGAQEGLEELLNLLPEVSSVVESIATAMGDVFADTGDALDGDKMREFLGYIDLEAGPALAAMAETLGNVTSGLASMMMAFDPLADDFSSGMVRMSQSFQEWAESLAGSEGLEEFIGYVREMGPLVGETFGAIASALVETAKAAAPVGAAVLPAIRELAEAFGALVGSPVGPWLIGTAAAVNALSLAVSTFKAANASSMLKFLGGLKGIGAIGALYGVNQGIRALEESMLQATPQADALARSLLNLGDAGAAARLTAELGNLGAALDRLADPGLRQSGFDTLHGMGSQMSLLASAAEFAAGYMGDFGEEVAFSSLEAERAIAAVEDALISIVSSGGAEQARQAFADLATAQGLSREEQSALLDMMPGYSRALEAAADAERMAGGATGEHTSAIDAQTAAMRQNLATMRTLRSERLAAANAELGYEAAIDDANKALKENGRTLDKTTAAGRANRQALLNLAASWNGLSDKAQNADGAHKRAIGTFVRVATQMGMNEDAARRYARRLMEIPPERKTQIRLEGADAAISKAYALTQALAAIRSKTVTVTTVFTDSGRRFKEFGPSGSADGGTVPRTGLPYADRHPYMLADGEEVISNRYGQADRHRDLLKAINANRLADGGTVTGRTGGGKAAKRRDRLEELVAAIMSALSSFDVSGALGRDEVRNPTARGVRDEISEMREAIKDAGGEWTKQMRNNAQRMVRQSRSIDVHQRALERETKRREELTNTLDEQQRAMEQLRSSMEQFSGQVAGNFLGDTFGKSYTVTEPGRVDPALQGRLSAAEQRLIALRSSPTGDSIAAAAEASRLLPQIAEMRAEVERQSQPVERTVSALEAMREELRKNAEDAIAFADALKGLKGAGLDPALFADLAASGDLGLAQELMRGGAGAVEEINDLWNQRAAAAAEVAAYATQTVYGEQQAALQTSLNAYEARLVQVNQNMKALEQEMTRNGNKVERGSDRIVNAIEGRLDRIEQRLSDLPREQQAMRRAGRGRG